MASSMPVTLSNGETLMMTMSDIRKDKYNGNVWTAPQWYDYGDADMAVFDAVCAPTEVGSATMCKGSSLVDFKMHLECRKDGYFANGGGGVIEAQDRGHTMVERALSCVKREFKEE